MNLETLTNQVVEISTEIGSYLKQEQLKFSSENIEIKGYNDFVSYVDQTSEQMFADQLLKILPEAGFLGEEDISGNIERDLNWVVDPLDGTTNFVHGLPIYCTSVALVRDKNVLLGVITDPNLKENFYAYSKGGAYLNGQKIRVSVTDHLNKSLLATGFPYNDLGKADEYLKVFRSFMETTRGIRRFGSAAIDLAHVACGRFDGFYEYGLNLWDVSAGAIIVQEAGGYVSDFKGTENYIEEKTLVAANSYLAEPMIEIISKYFK